MKYLKAFLVWFLTFIAHLWAFGVIYFCSFPESKNFRLFLGIAYVAVIFSFFLFQKEKKKFWIYGGGCFTIILIWFCSIKPNPQAIYPEHLKAPFAEFNGDKVTLHNVRFNRYRTRDDFDVFYETRTYDISTLQTADIYFNYWGMDQIAHAFVSFGFEDGRYLPISIEIRPEVGEVYGMLDGFFKQYEILYLWADERDIVLTRTNVRKEEAYLYRTKLNPQRVRLLFKSMLERTNQLAQNPEFYNTIFESCTNTIGDHVKNAGIVNIKFWQRRLRSGVVDQQMYKMGLLDTSKPFEDLRKEAYINKRAVAASNNPNFSNQIRTHLTMP